MKRSVLTACLFTAGFFWAQANGDEAPFAGLLQKDLLGSWSFDTATGAAFPDLSANRFIAKVKGGVKWARGKIGPALEFGENQSRVELPVSPTPVSFTFQAWAKPASVPASTPAAIIGRPGFHNSLAYTPAKKFMFEIYNAEKKATTVTSATTYEPGEWHLVGGSYDKDSGKLKLFVDGKLAGSAEVSGELFSYAAPWFVGCANPNSPSYGYWFSGLIDEVKVFSRALDADEMGAYFTATQSAEGPAASALYGKNVAFIPPADKPRPIDDELIRLVKAESPVEAKIVRQANGIPSLAFNGRAVPFLGGDVWCAHPYSNISIEPFFQAGMEIVNIQINLAKYSPKAFSVSPLLFMGPYWTGKNQYDPSVLEKIVWRALQSSPKAKIIFWIWIDPYPEWTAEHPDDLMQNEKGEYAYGNDHLSGYTSEFIAPKKGSADRLFWSFFSEAFREDVSEALRHFVRDVDALVPGQAVAGYLIGGGQDCQLYHWQPPNPELMKSANWGDFGPAAKKAWKRWLEKKYGNTGKLSEAWGMNVASFVEVAPPAASELVDGTFFHDPRSERRAMDWKRFVTEGRLVLIEHFAKVLKETPKTPRVVGACVGDSGSRRDLTTVSDFCRSPNLDFFLHQATYSQRLPGNIGGINAHLASMALNGKVFTADWDHPTFLQTQKANAGFGAGIVSGSSSQGYAENMDILRAMWRRDFAHLWATGAGSLWDHVFGEPYAFASPEIIDEMKFLVETSKRVKPFPVNAPGAEVALVYDEKAVDFLRKGLGSLQYIWARKQLDEFLLSGVPFGAYYAEDLREGKIPKAKVYVIQNALDLDERLVSAIEKLKRDGATIVFLRDTGYAQSFSDTDKVSALMGMKLARAETVSRYPDRLNEEHPLVNWNPSGKSTDALVWPRTWTVFGPFEKNESPNLSGWKNIPSDITSGARSVKGKSLKISGGYIDFQSVLSTTASVGRQAVAAAEIESASDREVTFGAGADWWMEWWVNGEKVFDTLAKGNENGSLGAKNHLFRTNLKKGKNLIAVRVISGSGGFALASGGPNEISGGDLFSAGTEKIVSDPDFTWAVVDPKAEILANYAGTEIPGFAVRDYGNFKTVFVGTRLLSRNLIQAHANVSGAWRVTRPGTVVAVGENFLMLHPTQSGPVEVSLKESAALIPLDNLASWNEKTSGSAKKDFVLDLKVGATYLYRLEK